MMEIILRGEAKREDYKRRVELKIKKNIKMKWRRAENLGVNFEKGKKLVAVGRKEEAGEDSDGKEEIKWSEVQMQK
ncbi:unnamed protein product [Blepharisma stoltei]|uniref:Uncharacterized protein n=1 Tax=Blepharisma stoltei TaxID=1481888 RepID=A0AAU9IFD4_9CILI|nr:unnamed protein product [Blepharisma stoltei]